MANGLLGQRDPDWWKRQQGLLQAQDATGWTPDYWPERGTELPPRGPDQPSIYPTPSLLNRIGTYASTIPRRISDFAQGAFHGLGPWGLRAAENILPFQQFSEERLRDIEQYGVELTPKTPAGQAGAFTGMMGGEVSGIGDIQALFSVPGLLGEKKFGTAALQAVSALPFIPPLVKGLDAVQEADLARRGLLNIRGSRLRTAIEQAPESAVSGQEWMNRLYRTEDVTPQAPKTEFPENYPVEDPRTPRQLELRPKRFAQGEGEWTGIQGLLREDPSRKFTRDELLRHMDERGVNLKETWRGEGEVRKVMNEESVYLTPEVRRVMTEDPGWGPEGVDPYEMILGNDANAYEELMGQFPELVDNEDWAEIVVGDVFPNRKYVGWDAARFEREIAAYEREAHRHQASGNTEEADRLWQEVHDMTRGQEASEGLGGVPAPKFEKYTQSGGTNYREVTLELEPLPNTREGGEAFTGRPSDRFTRGHFDEPNVLVHVRMKDRTYTNPTTGKEEKVLFIEEMQSDWHQKGRAEGYRPSADEIRALSAESDEVRDQLHASGATWPTPEENLLRARYHELQKAIQAGGIPDAPYKDTGEWTELAIKRMTQEGIDGGYDRVAFASGEQAAELYDLRKYVESVEYTLYDPNTLPDPFGMGGGRLRAYNDAGERIIDETGITPEQLPDYIGKEPAQRLMDVNVGDEYVITEKQNFTTKEPLFRVEGPNVSTSRDTREAAQQAAKEFSETRYITGEDLAVGGEGMVGYYDEILPSTIKRYGNQVGGIELEEINLRRIDLGAEDLTLGQLRQGARELGIDDVPIVQEWIEVMDVDGGTSTDAMQGFNARESSRLRKYEGDILGQLKYGGGAFGPTEGLNLSFEITPEMREAVEQGGQRLWGAGGIGLLGIGAYEAQQRDDKERGLLYGPPR